MIIQLNMKTPDAAHDAAEHAANEASFDGVPEEDRADERKELRDEIHAALCKWLTYGEYAMIEIDTEADTATVIRP